MTAAALTYNIPALATPFDAGASNSVTPTPTQFASGWIPNVDIVAAEQQNYLHNASTAYLWLVQQLGLAMPFNPVAGASVVATKAGGIVSLRNNSTNATEFYVAKTDRAIGYTDPSLDPTNWQLINFNELSKYGAVPVTLASASTVNIGAALSANISISGTTTITAFDTITAGALRFVTYSGAVPITYNVTSMQLIGGTSRTNAVGDTSVFESLGSGNWKEIDYQMASGGILGTASASLPSFTCTQASNALTISAVSQFMAFRNTTAATGTPITVNTGTPANLVIPATSNLGMLATTVSNRLVILEAYNAGTPVLCVVNIAGGNVLDETNLISPTTIGASSNTANVIYSAVACAASSPYRVIGFVDVVFTTGTGWSSPTLVQPCGGQALTALSSLGYGQTYSAQTRTSGTTYYNIKGKPISVYASIVNAGAAATATPIVNGVSLGQAVGNVAGSALPISFIVPPGGSYSITYSNAQNAWVEF